MEYTTKNTGDTDEVLLSGKLTFEHQKMFRQMISELKESSSNRWVIDLVNLEYIDSAGLGLLLRVKSVGDKEGKDTALRVPKEGQVNQMLEVSRFDQLFPYA